MAALLGSLFTSPVVSGLEEGASLKVCLAQRQRREQGGADIHPQSHSPGIILIFSILQMRRLSYCDGMQIPALGTPKGHSLC